MSDDVKASVGTVSKYFGKLPGTTLVDFKNEYNKLTAEDKLQLTKGILDGSLTY